MSIRNRDQKQTKWNTRTNGKKNLAKQYANGEVLPIVYIRLCCVQDEGTSLCTNRENKMKKRKVRKGEQ